MPGKTSAPSSKCTTVTTWSLTPTSQRNRFNPSASRSNQFFSECEPPKQPEAFSSLTATAGSPAPRKQSKTPAVRSPEHTGTTGSPWSITWKWSPPAGTIQSLSRRVVPRTAPSHGNPPTRTSWQVPFESPAASRRLTYRELGDRVLKPSFRPLRRRAPPAQSSYPWPFLRSLPPQLGNDILPALNGQT